MHVEFGYRASIVWQEGPYRIAEWTLLLTALGVMQYSSVSRSVFLSTLIKHMVNVYGICTAEIIGSRGTMVLA